MTGGERTVGEIGERALIARIRAAAPPPPAWVVLGIGDDAAVVEAERNHLEVLTTDALVEGIHFERRWSSFFDLGAKAVAVSLSDLAAMGADPRALLLSLALPPATRVSDVDALVAGVLDVALEHRATLVGGNVTQSTGPIVIDVTVTGSVRRRRILRRSGARPGDELFVSGSIGAAAAGLMWLRMCDDRRSADVPEYLSDAVGRYRRPRPRVRLGQRLGRSQIASACMDSSDGLADAVRQLAEASGTGALLDAAALPIDAGARRLFESQGLPPIEAALAGGEDYELLFAVRPRAARRLNGREPGGVRVSRIGVLTPDPRFVVRSVEGETSLPEGFGHFRALAQPAG